MNTNQIIYVILSLFILTGCSDLIEYSPYDTNIHTYRININETTKIANELQSASDTLRFGFISDTHDYYDDLADAIEYLNDYPGLQFVICGGDITNLGLAQEFKWYLDVTKKSKHPLITMIGNHEYRSNGYKIYTRLFGPSNLSFISGRYKFILFDNVIWENNNLSPEYEWLANELSDTSHYNIVLSHIPPYAGEMKGIHNLTFTKTVNADNTMLCLHGHTHRYNELTYNGISTIVSGDIRDRMLCIISLFGRQYSVKLIVF